MEKSDKLSINQVAMAMDKDLEKRVKELKRELKTSKQRVWALEETEKYFQAFFKNGPDGVVVVDPETARPISFNDQACRQLGYSREEFAGLRITDIEAKKSNKATRKLIQSVTVNGVGVFEIPQRTKQGEIKHFQVSAQAIDIAGRQLCHCIWRDITDSKTSEDALRESKEKYRQLFELESDAIFLIDKDTGKILE
ncbi:MAG: PAS domain S-box protein, partial [Thermodesulfobacteriota bacterium]